MNRFVSVLLVACASLCSSALCLQSNAPSPSGVSSASGSLTASGDPDAIALMQRVLNTMGGAGAWRAVGAAATNVTRSSPDGTQKQVHWTDDWSGSSVLSRRDAIGSPAGPHTVIASGPSQSHIQANGTQKRYPRDPDLIVLAVGYPGAAILRSLQRPNCTFSKKLTMSGRWPRQPLTENQDETIVYEQCIEPFFVDGRCDIAWIVSADMAALRGVWLPVRGMLSNSVTYEQVRYERFQPVGPLSVPSRITITRPNGQVDNLLVDSPTFSTQMPSSVFKPGK